MTQAMKRNARRSRQRALKPASTILPQTIIQVCPVITTSNPFEVLYQNAETSKKNATYDHNVNKALINVHNKYNAPRKSVHERLGLSSQPIRKKVHQRLGPKKQSVFERLGPYSQSSQPTKKVENKTRPIQYKWVPKLTIQANLDSQKSSNSPTRIVEAMMVNTGPNPYARPRPRRFDGYHKMKTC
jgi:hypothetical protein